MDGLGAPACRSLTSARPVSIEGTGFLAVVSSVGQRLAMVPVGPAGRPGFPDLGPLISAHPEIPPLPDAAPLGLVGVDALGEELVACGSASVIRGTAHRHHDREEALQSLRSLRPASGRGCPHSDHLYRFITALDRGRPVLAVAAATHLRSELLFGADLIAPFSSIPAGDNGLAVSDLAVQGDHLWVALQGPVLHGMALLVRLDSRGRRPVVFPLDLGGWGATTICSAAASGGAGLWLTSGPTLQRPGPVSLWRWTPPSDDDDRGELVSAGILPERPAGLCTWEGQLYGVFAGAPPRFEALEAG